MLNPEWEKLAAKTKNVVKVAYWDTTSSGPTPRIVGQIQGTPTIKIFTPVMKKNKKNRKKVVLDYQYERKAKAMINFAYSKMNSFVEVISNPKKYEKYVEKSNKFGLPKALLFTKSTSTKPLLKYMSTEFRRKLLIGEVRMTKVNKSILKQYSIAFGADTTLLLVNDGGGEHEVYSKGKFTFNKVRNFLQKHALKEAVKGPVKKEQKSEPEATKKEL